MIGLTIPRSITEALVLEVKEPPHIDARATQLEAFFSRHHCPAFNDALIPDYLTAAGKYGIPYNLLPSISIVESTCGRHYPKATNNIFGWNSAKSRFASIPESIDYISQQLSTSRYYKNKSVIQKLHAYNPNPSYAVKIIGLMKEISNE